MLLNQRHCLCKIKFKYLFFQAKSDAGNGWIQGGGGGQSDIDGDLSRRSEPEMEYHNRRASDVDTDYRREMLNSVHSEARGRDGGRRDVVAPPSIYQQAATLNTREIEISQVGLFNILIMLLLFDFMTLVCKS